MKIKKNEQRRNLMSDEAQVKRINDIFNFAAVANRVESGQKYALIMTGERPHSIRMWERGGSGREDDSYTTQVEGRDAQGTLSKFWVHLFKTEKFANECASYVKNNCPFHPETKGIVELGKDTSGKIAAKALVTPK
jgi:hypothetical protein